MGRSVFTHHPLSHSPDVWCRDCATAPWLVRGTIKAGVAFVQFQSVNQSVACRVCVMVAAISELSLSRPRRQVRSVAFFSVLWAEEVKNSELWQKTLSEKKSHSIQSKRSVALKKQAIIIIQWSVFFFSFCPRLNPSKFVPKAQKRNKKLLIVCVTVLYLNGVEKKLFSSGFWKLRVWKWAKKKEVLIDGEERSSSIVNLIPNEFCQTCHGKGAVAVSGERRWSWWKCDGPGDHPKIAKPRWILPQFQLGMDNLLFL